MDASPLELDQHPLDTSVSVDGSGAAVRRAPREPRQSRSKTKRKVKASSRDKRRKTWSKGITAKERREMLRANGFSRLIRRPLNTTLDFHPCHLTDYPSESLDAFFGGSRTRISTWLQRKRIGTYSVWTRENYKGERREHLHMVLHLPVKQRALVNSAVQEAALSSLSKSVPGSRA